MNAAQRRHYDAIQQLAREEWPADEPPTTQHLRPSLGDNVSEKVGTFHTLADGTIVLDDQAAR